MKCMIVLLVALAFVNCHPGFQDAYPWSAVFDATPYQRGEVLHPDYLLFWTVDQQARIVTFAAVVKTSGWVGLGLSDNGGMKGADIALLFPYEGGSYFNIEDAFSSDYVTPQADDSQDKYLIQSETGQHDGVTTFVFYRPIQSCDKIQDRDIVAGQQWVIFAFGTSNTFSKHAPSNRGQKLLSILTPKVDISLPDDVMTYDILSPTFEVPAVETIFACFSYTLPADRKYHVVRIEPIVPNENVHHINIFLCPGDLNKPEPETCSSEASHICDQMWYGWARGEIVFNAPAEAGFPMGSGDDGNNAHFLLVEIHYENPSRQPFVDEGSGFRLFFTPTLRPNDIGVLITGDYEFSLPANTFGYTIENRCPGACTQKIPEDGVTVLFTRFHMHQHGYSANLTQIRDGVELAPLAVMQRYDYELQNCVAPPVQAKILPGDNIITYCNWDTLGKPTETTWGQAADDEMCRAFIYHYPRSGISDCHYSNLLDRTKCSHTVVVRSADPTDYVYSEPMPSYTTYQPTCDTPRITEDPLLSLQTLHPSNTFLNLANPSAPKSTETEPSTETLPFSALPTNTAGHAAAIQVTVATTVQQQQAVPTIEIPQTNAQTNTQSDAQSTPDLPPLAEPSQEPLRWEDNSKAQSVPDLPSLSDSDSLEPVQATQPTLEVVQDSCSSKTTCASCISSSNCIYCSMNGYLNTGMCYDVSIKQIDDKCKRLGGKVTTTCASRVRSK